MLQPMISVVIIVIYSNDYMLTNLTNRDCDRFIPNRQNIKAQYMSSPVAKNPQCQTSLYNNLIKRQLFSSQDNISLSSFSSQLSSASASQSSKSTEFKSKLQPNVGSPVKILDTPKFKDDFYLNNIDWSQNGPLGIALDNEVFLYTPQNLQLISSYSFGSHVTGLKIEDQIIAIGLSSGEIELFDIHKCAKVRTLSKHQDRVSSLIFMDNLLVSGSKDKSIVVNDIRQRDFVVKEFTRHRGEVCTLKAKNISEKIFASGSVDGSAIVWDLKLGFISQMKAHKGAVKALDWCPWRNGILATGGGSQNDKSIKIWNTTNQTLLHKERIGTQISSILWNQQLNMMISSHGYPQNQLQFWSLDSTTEGGCRLKSREKFKAHSGRILNLLQSHDQSYLCTVSADETLKFWYMFESDSNPFHREAPKQLNRGSPQRL